MADPIVTGRAVRVPTTHPRESAGTPKVISDARLRFDIKQAGAPSELEQRLSEALMKVQDRADRAYNAIQAAIAALPNDTDADASRAVLELLKSNSASLSSELFDVAGMVLLAAQGSAANVAGESKPDNIAERFPEGIDLEDEGFRLDRLFALLAWIERARALTSNLEFLSVNYPEFQAAAHRHNLRCSDAMWDDDESDALRFLISDATLKGRRITEAGKALEQQKGARHA